MSYIGNVNAFESVGTSDLEDGAVTAAKVADDVATQAELDLKAPLASPSFTGNVGIGTASPSNDLTLNVGSGATDGLYIYGEGGAKPTIYLGHDGSHGFDATIQSDATDGNLKLTPRGGFNTVFTAGSVGIGTSSPTDTLHVQGTLNVQPSTYNKISSYFSGSYISGFKFSDLNGGIWYDAGVDDLTISAGHANSQLIMEAGGAERMRIDSSGNVDITTGNLFTDTTSGIFFSGGINSFTNGVYGVGVNNVAIAAGGAERMRIDSSGNVLVGKTSSNIATAGIELQGSGIYYATRNGTTAYFNRLTTNGEVMEFRKNNVDVGNISVTGSATSYNTSSDYRLKTNVTPMTGATAAVKLLKPCNFDWIADGSNVNGFLAHELAEVVPEAATGTKDAMMDEEYEVSAATGDVFTAGSEAGFTEVSAAVKAEPAYYDVDGNVIKAEVIAQSAVHEAYEAIAEVIHSADVEQPETLEEGQQWRETTAQVMGTRSVPDMQGIDQAKIVPLLTATIQELIARIETLEGE